MDTLVAVTVKSILLSQPDWFKQRVAEAAMWTRRLLSESMWMRAAKDALWRGEPSSVLRSEALNPAVFGAASFRGDRANIPTSDAVEKLVRRRAELMLDHIDDAEVNIEHGRLLLYTPEDSLSDGAATVASKGFFDVDNVPAWDTWLYYDGRTLVCWVPPQLVPSVQLGLDVNPEACVRWVYD